MAVASPLVDSSDPWGAGSGDDPWSHAAAAGGTAPSALTQTSCPTEPEKSAQEAKAAVWGDFQAGKAEAPEASWKDQGRSGRSWGGGRGGWKNSGTIGPSGPDLPRKRVSTEKVDGKVLEWKGKYGWIRPAQSIQHPKASQRQGRIFVSKTDLGDGLWELTPGTVCRFHIFEDDAGLGAEDVAVVSQSHRTTGGGYGQRSQGSSRGIGGSRGANGSGLAGGRGAGARTDRPQGGRGRGGKGDSSHNGGFTLPGYEKLQPGASLGASQSRRKGGGAGDASKGAAAVQGSGTACAAAPLSMIDSNFSLPCYAPMMPPQPLGNSGYGLSPMPAQLAEMALASKGSPGDLFETCLFDANGSWTGVKGMAGFMDLAAQGKGGRLPGMGPCHQTGFPGVSMPDLGAGASAARASAGGLAPGMQGWGAAFLSNRAPPPSAVVGAMASAQALSGGNSGLAGGNLSFPPQL